MGLKKSILYCCRLDWPIRTLSFSHDGKMLASASEDLVIDIAEVETGRIHMTPAPSRLCFEFMVCGAGSCLA